VFPNRKGRPKPALNPSPGAFDHRTLPEFQEGAVIDRAFYRNFFMSFATQSRPDHLLLALGLGPAHDFFIRTSSA